MLINAIDQFQTDPALALITLAAFSIALIVGITFHEFSHAYVANALGDGTARGLGRLTLNPIAHLDPLGTILIFVAGFGWGKPVPFNPFFLRVGMRRGAALVSLAGPAANVVAATVFAIPIRLGVAQSDTFGFSALGTSGVDVLGYLLVSLVFWNLLLAVFNLLPIAPLDGFKVVLGVLPRSLAAPFSRLEPWGPGILLLVIALGFISPNFRLFSTVIGPPVNFMSRILLGQGLI